MTVPAPDLPLRLRPSRYVPLGARRWDWHSKVYLGAIVVVGATEVHAILANVQQRREVAQGLRETVDYCHRTFSECWTALTGWHPDDRNAPWAKSRRAASTMFLSWFPKHIEGQM